jgi:hypothetical protein
MAGLTRLNLNLHPRAAAALGRVEARTGDSRTDSVNRAVQVYDVFLDLTARGRLQVELPDGTREVVTIL